MTCLSNIDVAILCGGNQTRIAHVIGGLPKILAPVQGYPVIKWQIDYLRRFGAKRILFLCGPGWKNVESWLKRHEPEDIETIIIVEDEPKGVVPALLNAIEHFQTDPILVMNGDTLLDADLCTLVSMYQSQLVLQYTIFGDSGIRILSRDDIQKTYWPTALPPNVVDVKEPFTIKFVDVGTIEGLRRANHEWKLP